MEGYHPLPQPEEVTKDEREDAMGGYLMMFAAIAVGLPLPIISLIASIIYYASNRHKGRFVHFHVLQALLSQIPTILLNAALFFWTVRILVSDELHPDDFYWGYLFAVIFANVLSYVFGIMAAVKARKGRFFYYVVFGKLTYHKVFVIKPEENQATPQNFPPKF